MRILPTVIAAMLFAAPAMATKPTPDFLAGGPEISKDAAASNVFIEENTYRFGQPYRSERGTTPEACAYVCHSDSQCAAWSLSPASFQMGPRCELSATPGQASHRPGTMSGISKLWQPSPERDGEMKYKVHVPEGYQPAPAPAVEPKIETVALPELLGEYPPKITAEMRPAPEPTSEPAPAPEVKFTEALMPEALPIETAVVDPVPTAPRPSAKPAELSQMAEAPAMVEAPAQAPLDLKTPAPAPKMVNAVRKPEPMPTPLPEPQKAAAAPSLEEPVLVNAVLKPGPTPTAAPAPQPAPPPAPNATEAAPIFFRTPWTQRTTADPDYSVGGTDYIPGDEEATSGLTEAGS